MSLTGFGQGFVKVARFCSVWCELGQLVSVLCGVSPSGGAGAGGHKVASGSCLMLQLGWSVIWRLAGKQGLIL